MATFTLAARGPFSLAASTRFLEGFAPAGYTAAAAGPLELAFPVESRWPTAGVRVRAHPHGVTGEILSPARPSRELAAAIRDQVADPVPGRGRVRLRRGGDWAIIGQRVRIRQAATVKARMSEQLGEPVSTPASCGPSRTRKH